MLLPDQREFSNDDTFAVSRPGGGKLAGTFCFFLLAQKEATLVLWSLKVQGRLRAIINPNGKMV